ncbi:retrovirus-related pol polyprotein from transposon TNT 1-94 [Tanacetum coccineum]
MRSFQTKQSVNKTNVSDGLFKQVTQQNLPQNRKQAEIHSNVLKPGMYRIATTTTQNKEPQLPHASRNTNPHVSKSSGVNHTTSVSRPQLKCYQVKDKVVPNNSQVKFKKKEVEDHHRISSISKKTKSVTAYVQLILFIVDSGCTKHMTGNLKLLCNFVEKFLGIVRFGNDQFAPILGYGDLNQGNVPTIKRVLLRRKASNHNLFSLVNSVMQIWRLRFRKSTCFVRDLQGNDLLTGNRGSDLYTISLQETTSSTPICFMAKASPTQAWLWHRRLSHLNFDYITLLSKKDIVTGLPKLKYVKDQLCSSCEMSKAKRSSFKSKVIQVPKEGLEFASHGLDKHPERFSRLSHDDFQRNLQAQVITVRTDRGTEFLNKTLHAYFKEEGIEHQTSTPRTPEQNGVVERRNRTLVEAARTMLSASKLPLSFWAEAVATACYTQNRSIIILTHGKTAYHLINDRKPSIKHLHIFGCICYITRDGENLDKMKEKGDPCVMVGYSTQSKGYRVYNKRTRLIVESIHIKFDEIKEMMSDHNSSDLAPQRQMASAENNTSGPAPFLNVQKTFDRSRSSLGLHGDDVCSHHNEPSSSKLVPKVVPLAVKTATSRQELELLFHHHIAMLRTTDDTKTPSLKLQLSSPNAPNAPFKTPSTKDTSSSSIDYIPKSPTSSSLLPNGYLNPPTSPPPRVSLPPPTQENASMDITLTLSPITPLDVQFDTPSPSPPILGHLIPWNLLEAHGDSCLCCIHNRTLIFGLRDELQLNTCFHNHHPTTSIIFPKLNILYV